MGRSEISKLHIRDEINHRSTCIAQLLDLLLSLFGPGVVSVTDLRATPAAGNLGLSVLVVIFQCVGKIL